MWLGLGVYPESNMARSRMATRQTQLPVNNEVMQANPMRKLRVLLVEDNPFLSESLKSILGQDSAFEVAGEVKDGIAAVSLARRLSPDLVLMDMSLPGIGGIAAARLIKDERLDTRVVLLADEDDRDYRQAAMDGGASLCLPKEGIVGELLKALRNMLLDETGFQI